MAKCRHIESRGINMTTIKINKTVFDEIQEKRSVTITDGKRKMEFTPDKLTVINSNCDNFTHIENVKNMTIKC